MTSLVKGHGNICSSSSETVHTTTLASSAESSLARIPLPLLTGSVEAEYRAQRTEEATALVWNCDSLKCDEPLQLRLPAMSKPRTPTDCNHSSTVQLANSYVRSCAVGKNNAFSALIAAYDDDTDER